MMDGEQEQEPAGFEPGWRDRLWAVGAASSRLLETRAAIFREELAEKGELFRAGLAGLFVAVLFGTIAGLLLAALLAAFLARLFGSPILGILATFLIFLGVAAGAGAIGVRKLSRMSPFEFPATRREIDRDVDAVRRAAGIGERERADEATDEPGRPLGASGETAEEIEARLREGAG
ncbi:MAG TPA: phage holin family protein [Thermoanaerobaculia bacterium]|nr:phage holin family protein [Thermoanaerobaculia bacterium]